MASFPLTWSTQIKLPVKSKVHEVGPFRVALFEAPLDEPAVPVPRNLQYVQQLQCVELSGPSTPHSSRPYVVMTPVVRFRRRILQVQKVQARPCSC
jgi:hypothetical protein